MDYFTDRNNRVFLSGVIVGDAEFSHEVYGEGFYEMKVSIPRLSGQADVLPVTVSERLISDKNLKIGSTINAFGQFRSYNKLIEGKSKLLLTVFVRELFDDVQGRNPNNIVLSGYLCKPPVYRTTPFNREIADLLVAVNRSYNKSDYIPCIAWGSLAYHCGTMEVGHHFSLAGRLQSRRYTKQVEGHAQERTAFEVSVMNLIPYEEESPVCR